MLSQAALWPPIVAGVAVHVIGWRIELLYHHVNFYGFLLLEVECGKCDNSRDPITPRASLTTDGCQKSYTFH